jgi:hypothetical protein
LLPQNNSKRPEGGIINHCVARIIALDDVLFGQLHDAVLFSLSLKRGVLLSNPLYH